jgi:acyl transferase domain-containing protein/NAD(P)H-dependent flavin oxidoreductase YrpB (nitropropane dioxygenase family)/NAD(P)-dependent dehydrogenase (short-subunit alcohol dehydrogenase family)/acyl carrier protein
VSAQLEVIGLSPVGFPGAAIGVAAHRAGYLGGLSLEHCTAEIIQEVLTAKRGTESAFTIAVDSITNDVLRVLKPATSVGLERVIVCRPESTELANELAAVHDLGLYVMVEVTSLAEGEHAQHAGADAIVVKGNESGGRVGEETSFILLQRIVPKVGIPVWARGGIGLHTAAACLACGAQGVVLDWQLALCEESELPDDVKARIARMDGSETAVLGQQCALRYRAYSRPGERAFAYLKEWEDSRGLDSDSPSELLVSWRADVEACVRGETAGGRLLLIGQDAAFSGDLAKRFQTVGGICDAIAHAAVAQCRGAARHRALRPGGPLAESHGTPYPILQGPMTRVSDTADFALAVAEGGGLPFLALALLRGPRVAELLEETKRKLGDRPWGIGILGFVPKELREEQLAEVRNHPPRFAIIAGGRPDQAGALESQGIHTYLHVPSPGLLQMFLRSGARRVIFEGRECGGHVGPRTSFVLWDTMVRVILEHLDDTGNAGDDYHVVFAGGIHDAASAAMVAAMTALLCDRGVRVGVLLGTSYLFTHEAVESGAITAGFQDEAIRCQQTILLESGVGHATRCANTVFGRHFAAEKRRLVAEGRSKDEIREALEMLNLGRLRIASKGIMRGDTDPRVSDSGRYRVVDDATQRREGMYMIGQVAALRNRVCSIRELHEDVSAAGTASLEHFVEPIPVSVKTHDPSEPSDIAIIGMSCLFPQADSLDRYWQNIVEKKSVIREVPPDRWDVGQYFDPNRRARDKIYSKWGGFLDDVPFDPLRYGMPPNSIPSIEPLHLLVLETVRAALEDAGYAERSFDREHTSVILGAGGGVADRGLGYGFRSLLPFYMREAGGSDAEVDALMQRLDGKLPEWTEDSFAGLLLNVAAGRVANRFDLGGTNYTVDAACASSLAAVRLAVNELESGSSNMVIVGGADTMQSPFAYLCFSKTQALSPTGQCRTFDSAGDGIVISEGVAVAVLKRLADAERDGDRIYAVIKGVGTSSDGRDKGLTAPRPAGQIRALERAYLKAGFSPATVGLIEAHGTGTIVGDQSEVESLTTMFSREGAKLESCALGSVKSMIGHTKCTAGVAGLLKAALALHHKVLPPTHGVTMPNAKARFNESPFHVNTETRPWVARADGTPRRAGVSAFGFGGTNFHAALEEYTPARPAAHGEPGVKTWPTELFLWRAASAAEIVAAIDALAGAIAAGAAPRLADLAAAVCREAATAAGLSDARCLAICADSIEDLVAKLNNAKTKVSHDASFRDPKGIYYAARCPATAETVAFVFPGQGSQRVDMLRELTLAYAPVREAFELADRALGDELDAPLSRYIFPPPRFTDQDRAADQEALTQTRVAQPALGAADLAVLRLLSDLGVRPDFACGHSYGELVALCAAGVMSPENLIRVSEARGRLIADAARTAPGEMAAVKADEATVRGHIAGIDGVWIANLNAPKQTVISGTSAGIGRALEALAQTGIGGTRLPVSCAFHSELIAGARLTFGKGLEQTPLTKPRFPVFSNTTATPHQADPAAIRRTLADHLALPVRFVDEIRAMHDAGARIFIEVGPGKVLTGLIERILDGQTFTTVNVDQPGRHGVTQLCHALARLATAGVALDAGPLFVGRTRKTLDLSRLIEETKPALLPTTTWVVNGAKAVPLNGKPVRTAATKLMPRPVTAAPAPTAAAAGTATVTRAPVPEPGQPSAPNHAAARTGESTVRADGADSVMTAYHDLMSKFLDTQRNVMLSYLQGGGSAAAAPPPQPVALEAVAAVATAKTDDPGATPQPAGHRAIDDSQPGLAPPSPPMAQPEAPKPVDRLPGPEPKTVAGPSREALTARLVAVVSERTGYPPEMLDLDLDLEADLGIDSIKRVEILGALQEESLLSSQPNDSDMEALAKLKSLRAIVDWVMDRASRPDAGAPSGADPVESAAPVLAATAGEPDRVPRMMVEAVDCGPVVSRPDARFSGIVIITDDGKGVAEAVAKEIESHGGTAAVVALEEARGTSRAKYVDLTDRQVVGSLFETLRSSHGRISGVLHLAPLAHAHLGGKLDLSKWRAAFDRDLHALFNMVQCAGRDLRDENGVVLTATRLGGYFGSLRRPDAPARAASFWPGSGAACGFIKTVGREWGEVRCKAVDFTQNEKAERIAHALLSEMAATDGIEEVGYIDGKRISLRPVAAPVEDEEVVGSSPLDGESVVLITGGARGITAMIADELAARFRCKLVLVGRSPLPPEDESADTAGLTDVKQTKSALMKQIEQGGQKPTPAQVEAAYKRLCSQREIRGNLAAMRAHGANVAYHSVDVADEVAFAALIEEVYRRYGRIDGVIHGAGVIEDKFLSDKTAESLERVVAPKVAGALALATHLRSESLKFMFFFSSVTARYGNRGQCDYAAANEFLNKLAHWLNSRWTGRVASLNWGPWHSPGGMVSEELAKQFAKAGVFMVTPQGGRRAFMEELLFGHKNEGEILFGGPMLGSAAMPLGPAVTGAARASSEGRDAGSDAFTILEPSDAPLLATRARVIRRRDDSIEVVRDVDLTHDLFLLDHQLDGTPVMPMAMALELIAETAAAGWPDLHLACVRDLRVLKGIVINNGPRTIRVLASVAKRTGELVELSIRAESMGDRPTLHYSAAVELRRDASEGPTPPRWTPKDPRPLGMSLDEIYDKWLFHGPLFAGITEVGILGQNGITGRIAPSSPKRLLAESPEARWRIDPVMLDSALQLAIVWTRKYLDMTPLPSRFGRYSWYGRPRGNEVECEVEVLSHGPGPSIHSRMVFRNTDGTLIGCIEDFEGTCSKALNRLAAMRDTSAKARP